jgi:GNAT superfamily N-acetyltransferase
VRIDCATLALESLSSVNVTHLEDCFDQHFGHVEYEWTPQAWRSLACVHDELVGHLSITTRTVTVGGTEVEVGGIGAVTTHAEWRRRGVAAALLDAAAGFMRKDLAVSFGLLICRAGVADVYASKGWRVISDTTRFAQPSGTATYPGLTMTLSLSDREWPRGDIDLQGLPW